jgi:hypothetical protein
MKRISWVMALLVVHAERSLAQPLPPGGGAAESAVSIEAAVRMADDELRQIETKISALEAQRELQSAKPPPDAAKIPFGVSNAKPAPGQLLTHTSESQLLRAMCRSVASKSEAECAARNAEFLPADSETCRDLSLTLRMVRALKTKSPEFSALCRSWTSQGDVKSSLKPGASAQVCSALAGYSGSAASTCGTISGSFANAKAAGSCVEGVAAMFGESCTEPARPQKEACEAAAGLRSGACRSPLCRALSGEPAAVCDAYLVKVDVPVAAKPLSKQPTAPIVAGPPPAALQSEAKQLQTRLEGLLALLEKSLSGTASDPKLVKAVDDRLERVADALTRLDPARKPAAGRGKPTAR